MVNKKCSTQFNDLTDFVAKPLNRSSIFLLYVAALSKSSG